MKYTESESEIIEFESLSSVDNDNVPDIIEFDQDITLIEVNESSPDSIRVEIIHQEHLPPRSGRSLKNQMNTLLLVTGILLLISLLGLGLVFLCRRFCPREDKDDIEEGGDALEDEGHSLSGHLSPRISPDAAFMILRQHHLVGQGRYTSPDYEDIN